MRGGWGLSSHLEDFFSPCVANRRNDYFCFTNFIWASITQRHIFRSFLFGMLTHPPTHPLIQLTLILEYYYICNINLFLRSYLFFISELPESMQKVR